MGAGGEKTKKAAETGMREGPVLVGRSLRVGGKEEQGTSIILWWMILSLGLAQRII